MSSLPENSEEKEIRDLLMKFFKEDQDKVFKWLITENPSLGGVMPGYMIRIGKGNKVLSFIKSCGEENEWLNDKP